MAHKSSSKIHQAMRKVVHTKAHPGFKAVEAKIASEPGIRDPGAVLGAASRNASAAAHKANPRLNRVKG